MILLVVKSVIFFKFANYLFFFAGAPHGFFKGRLVLVRPPFGWSTGFIAIPLTVILCFFIRSPPVAYP